MVMVVGAVVGIVVATPSIIVNLPAPASHHP